MHKLPLTTSLTTTTTVDQTTAIKHLHSGTLHPWTGERFKRTCNSFGIQVHLKGTNTIKTLFMASKDRDSKLHNIGVIYRFQMSTHPLSGSIHRGIQQNLWGQVQGTLRAPFPIHHHGHSTGHPVNPECFTIVDWESQGGHQKHKGGYVHSCKWPFTQQKLGKVPTLTHMGPSFTRHTWTWAQITQLYQPHYRGQTPYNKYRACATSFGEYCTTLGFTFTVAIIPPYTPNTQTPQSPYTQFQWCNLW